MTDALAVMALLPAVLPVWRTVMVPETVFLLVEFPEMVFLLVWRKVMAPETVFLPVAFVPVQMVEFLEAVFLLVWRTVMVLETVFLPVASVLMQMVEFLEAVFLQVAFVLIRVQGGRSRRSWHIHLCRNLQESFARKTVP